MALRLDVRWTENGWTWDDHGCLTQLGTAGNSSTSPCSGCWVTVCRTTSWWDGRRSSTVFWMHMLGRAVLELRGKEEPSSIVAGLTHRAAQPPVLHAGHVTGALKGYTIGALTASSRSVGCWSPRSQRQGYLDDPPVPKNMLTPRSWQPKFERIINQNNKMVGTPLTLFTYKYRYPHGST